MIPKLSIRPKEEPLPALDYQYRVLVGKDARMMDFLYRLNPKSAAAMIATQMARVLAK